MSDYDGVKIYAAGKITKNGWRHPIFPIHDWVDDLDHPFASQWPTSPRIASLPGAVYVGPHFLSDDHGCYHGPNTHGVAAGGAACGEVYPGLDRSEVVRRCFEAIRRCTHVFAWIDDPTAYGSLVELGYAQALGKQTYVYMCDEIDELADLWFVGHAATAVAWVRNLDSAWADFHLRLLALRGRPDARPMLIPVRLPSD